MVDNRASSLIVPLAVPEKVHAATPVTEDSVDPEVHKGKVEMSEVTVKRNGEADVIDSLDYLSQEEGTQQERTCGVLETITGSNLGIRVSPGLDGITGILIRKSNLKRMGLLSESEEECLLVAAKTFQKKAVLQDIARRGKESDWNDHKALIKAYPLEELLLVRDDAGSYGANYLMPFSEAAFNAVAAAVEEARSTAAAAKNEAAKKDRQEKDKEAKQKLRDEDADVPLSPREWLSDTVEATGAEIEAMTPKERLAPQMLRSSTRRRTLQADVLFESFNDRVHSLKAPKKSFCVNLKQEVEFGLQAVSEQADGHCQAAGEASKTAETQHDGTPFTVRSGDSFSVSRKDFKSFFLRVADMVEEALQHNETLDILHEDYGALAMSSFPRDHAAAEGGFLKALTFSDLTHTKNKMISSIKWIPCSEELVACSVMDNASFDERIDAPGRLAKSLVIVWSLQHPLTPQHMFLSPADITSFCLAPSAAYRLYLVAGLLNGQVSLLLAPNSYPDERRKAKLLKFFKGDKCLLGTARMFAADLNGSAHPALVVSAIEFSHKRPVQHLTTLPPNLDFRRSLAIYFNPQAENIFVLSCAADGCLFVWDVGTAIANAKNPEFLWKPTTQCQLRRQDPGGPLGCCHLALPPLKAQTVSSEFWASTEEGDVLFGDWGASLSDAKSDHIKQYFSARHYATRCLRPPSAFQLSPFLPRIALLVNDFAFHILRLGCSRPLYSSPTPSSSYSCGAWSATRPGVLFVGRKDGSLEAWDLREQLRKPTIATAISAAALTALAFPDLQQPRQNHGIGRSGSKSRKLTQKAMPHKNPEERFSMNASLMHLAVGDAAGTLRILKLPTGLAFPQQQELVHVANLLLKEDGRMGYLDQREAVLKKAAEEKSKQYLSEKAHKLRAELVSEPDVEAQELEIMEQAYKRMEEAFLKAIQWVMKYTVHAAYAHKADMPTEQNFKH
ncbi:hypothetical protein Efla_005279 [Eimeria flavescens]